MTTEEGYTVLTKDMWSYQATTPYMHIPIRETDVVGPIFGRPYQYSQQAGYDESSLWMVARRLRCGGQFLFAERVR